MKIMKTDLLLLNNKNAKESAAAPAISMPAIQVAQPAAGINALMFKGMQNLMANPKLAQGVGVMNDDAEAEKDQTVKSNVAFKANLKTTAKVVIATATAAAGLQSCEKNYYTTPPAENKTEITITITNEATNQLLTNMLSVLTQMLAQQKLTYDQYQAYFNQITQWQNQTSGDLSAIKVLLTTIANKVIDIDNGVQENNAYQQIIISMLESQGMSHNQAIAYLQQIIEWAKQHGNDVYGALTQIMDKLDLVNQNLENLTNVVIDARDKAAEDRAALYNIALQIKNQGEASLYQQQIMIAQNNAMIMQNNTIINGQKTIVKSLRESTADLKATIQEAAASINMSVENLATVVVRTGKSLEEVMKMSKAEIIAVLEANNEELQNVNNNLQNLDTDVVKAAEQILEALKKISAQLSELSKQFADAAKMFKNKLNTLTSIAQGIYMNGVFNNMKLDQLNKQIFDLGKDVKSLKQTAIDIKNNLENGISVDTSELEELLKTLNLSVNASKDEIIAKLDTLIANQEKLEAAINKMGDENNSKLDYIASLIQNITPDNASLVEAINNLALSNEENIAAATEALAAKLDALIAKVDAALGKMDNLAALLQQYGDKIIEKLDGNSAILQKIKENGDSLNILVKLQNMSLNELKAEFEKIKPELQKLNTSATTANAYLDILTKRQLEIKEQIANLEVIAGKALTKDELEELWQKHDSVGFAKAKLYLDAIHAEDIKKADEIIGYLKKGNETAKDTYNLLLDFANKNNLTMEELRDLLKAVYEYLPNLICKCDCKGNCDNNDGTHEGIIGVLN